MKKINKSGGLVKMILLIVVGLVVLGYFGYNLRDIVNSPSVGENLAYAWDMVKRAWNFLVGLLPERN
ncbi:MAG: hypothetical protein AAB846_00290 [Patescibacteria group bacterium]